MKIVIYKRRRGKPIRIRLLINGGIYMATQIAATPVIYGLEAKKILEESRMEPSKKSQENGKILLDFFNKIISYGK